MNILCKLGIHSYYLDSAMFSSDDVCRRCDKRVCRSGNLTRERELWEEAANLPPSEQVGFVLEWLT